MTEAAAAERFEQAAQLRDALRTIETQLQQRQQKMAGTGLGDRDAFGIKVGPAGAVVQVFQVRGGKVDRADRARQHGGRRTRWTEDGRAEGDRVRESDVLQAALEQFYAERAAPPEIHLPIELNPARNRDARRLADRQVRTHRVRLVVPKRGEKRGLLDLAARNAQVAYQTRFNENGRRALRRARDPARWSSRLPAIPRRIECFDISTIQGLKPSRRWWSAKTAE